MKALEHLAFYFYAAPSMSGLKSCSYAFSGFSTPTDVSGEHYLALSGVTEYKQGAVHRALKNMSRENKNIILLTHTEAINKIPKNLRASANITILQQEYNVGAMFMYVYQTQKRTLTKIAGYNKKQIKAKLPLLSDQLKKALWEFINKYEEYK